MEDRAWEDDAACRQSDPDLWTSENAQKQSDAKKICKTQCDVREQCLAYAIETREVFGIWGGLGYSQRRRLWTPARS